MVSTTRFGKRPPRWSRMELSGSRTVPMPSCSSRLALLPSPTMPYTDRERSTTTSPRCRRLFLFWSDHSFFYQAHVTTLFFQPGGIPSFQSSSIDWTKSTSTSPSSASHRSRRATLQLVTRDSQGEQSKERARWRVRLERTAPMVTKRARVCV